MTNITISKRTPLMLASTSAARARILSRAGLEFSAVSSEVNEAPIKKRLLAKGEGSEVICQTLSDAKAAAVSNLYDDALVLGGDQMLELEGALFDKPGDRAAAANTLRSLSGKTHRLPTALSIALGCTIIWRHLEVPELTMHDLADAEIEMYLDHAEPGILGCVGAYMIEGSGVQLFSNIKGDHFAIQGLPLLPLLSFLRKQNLELR